MKRLLLPLALGLAISSLHGSVIVNDTTDFSSWFKGSTTGTLDTSGSTLVWSPPATAGGFQNIGRAFEATTLEIGDTLHVSMDWTQSVASVGIIRLGLYSVANPPLADGWSGTGATAGGTLGEHRGFYSLLQDNASGSSSVRYEYRATNTGTSTTPLQAATATPGTTSTVYDINQDGTVTYKLILEITRTANNTYEIFSSLGPLGGGDPFMSVSGTANNLSNTSPTFNSLFIRSSGGTSTFDNIRVELNPIPEPASFAAIASLSILVMVVTRRRRR